MRQANLFRLLLVCLALSACIPVPGRGPRDAPPPQFAPLAGVWEDPETQDRHTIRWNRGRFTVTSVESSGGERYAVDRVSWNNGVLTWRFRIPVSRYYAITLATRTVTERTLTLDWTDTEGTTSELTLRRVQE